MTSKRRQNSKQQPAQQSTPPKEPKPVEKPLPAHGPGRMVIFTICLVISMVFYGNTLKNGYSLDDELVTLGQRNVEQGISGIPGIFTSRYSVNVKQNYEYRPIALASFALEYQFFGRNPAASHFFNILLYALVAFLVYLTVARLFPHHHWSLPVLSMLIFLIHPLHSEVVASLKNRDELLAFLFTLLSLNAFMRFVEKRKWTLVLLGMVYFLVAILSKKSCMPYVALIPFTLVYVYRLKALRTFGFSVLVLAGFLAMMLLTKRSMLTQVEDMSRNLQFFENPLYVGDYGFGQIIMMAIATFGFYVKMALIPYPLVSYYGYNTFDGFSFGMYHVWGIAGIVLMGWLIYRYWFTNKPMVWGAIVFVAGISMFTNLLVPAVGIVAERFGFEASLGVSVMLATAILMLFKSFQLDLTAKVSNMAVKIHQNVKITTAVLVLISAIVVIPRNAEWFSQVSLYEADIVKVPRSAKLNSLLGTVYAQRLQAHRNNVKMLDRPTYERYADSSIYFFTRALAAYPDYTSVVNNLGTIYINYRYNLDSSVHYFGRAIALDSQYVEALGNYAVSVEAQAEIEREKLNWINALPLDSAGQTNVLEEIKKLNAYNKVFGSVAQMKSGLQQLFTMAITGQQSGDRVKRGFELTVAQGATDVEGKSQPGVDKTGYMQTLMAAYENLRTTGKLELLGEVTDSVTALYFNPVLNRVIPAGIRSGVNAEVRSAIEKKMLDCRNESAEHFRRSLELRPENGSLYTKAATTLQRWKMTDALIGIHGLMLKVKSAKLHTIEFNMARTYFQKNDYANGYLHTQKAFAETEKMMKRIKLCIVDFSRAGNQFSINYFSEALKANKANVNSFAARFIPELQQHGMAAEAEKLAQQVEKINKTK